LTRPRLAKLTGLAREAGAKIRLRRAVRSDSPPSGSDAPPPREAEEIGRRLEATRDRMRREAPPAEES
jgi:hypothetical protein